MQSWLEVVIIFVLLLANGMFAMAEIALVSARKARLQQRAEDGESGAKTALELSESPNRFLSTTQIGISLIGVLAGAFGGATLSEELAILIARIPSLAPYSELLALLVVVLIITYFSLVIGELIPKRVALNNPESIAVGVAGFMRFLSRLTSPIVNLLSASTDLGIRLLGIQPSTDPPITEDEIKVLVEQGTRVGVFDEVEQDIIEGVLRLGDRRVDAVMTPRTEVTWLDLDDPAQDNIQIVLESSHSYFPLAVGNLDNVVGILRARDLLRAIVRQNGAVNLRELAIPPLFVPESNLAYHLLEEFRRTGQHMALIVDEYGGMMGLVTLFDLMEAIAGDFPEQGSAARQDVVQREDGSWLMDGLIDINDFKEILDLDELPGEDRVGFQTLGGFIMSHLGNIPVTGQTISVENYLIEVVDMDGRRVDKVLVRPVPVNTDEIS